MSMSVVNLHVARSRKASSALCTLVD